MMYINKIKCILGLHTWGSFYKHEVILGKYTFSKFKRDCTVCGKEEIVGDRRRGR